MRQLVLLRGPMGVGKSTWVTENGLEPYTLSADKIRILFSSPLMTENGLKINPANESRVWEVLMDSLEVRMQNGDFTIVDATHVKQSAISAYKHLCERYKYRCYVIEFEEDLDTVLERNNTREEYKQVPEHVVANAHTRMTTEYVPKWVTRLKPETAMEELRWKKSDYNDYKNVLVIGDIHGSYDALMELFITFNKDKYGIDTSELQDDTLYIFVGDYLDRGTQHAEMLNWLINNYRQPGSNKHRTNMILLEGNHEQHLVNYAYDERVARVFYQTKKDIEDAGIEKREIKKLSRAFQQVAYFTYHGSSYVVTHGGLPRINLHALNLIATNNMIRGVGNYQLNIDELYSKMEAKSPEDEATYQIHGHRNIYRLPIDMYEHSYNLEGKVEFGGYLRAVLLSGDERSFYEIKNNNFKIPENNATVHDDATVEEFLDFADNHEEVKVVELPDNISSYNFTRKAFTKGFWDDVTIKARGLFINTEDNYISARGYEKFFNEGERHGYKVSDLSEADLPIRVFHKYNGFLGLASYDKATDSLKYYSKSLSSDIGAEHALMVKEVIEYTMPEQNIEKMRQMSKDYNVTFVFEIIHPEKDPHIIEYEEPAAVLLDVVYNELEFDRMDYSALKTVGRMLQVPFKALEHEFTDWKKFISWFLDKRDENNLSDEIEGWVIETSTGKIIKLKSNYYNTWKKLRGMISKIRKNQSSQISHGSLYRPFENEFLYFLKHEADEEDLASQNLIKLRNQFEEKEEDD